MCEPRRQAWGRFSLRPSGHRPGTPDLGALASSTETARLCGRSCSVCALRHGHGAVHTLAQAQSTACRRQRARAGTWGTRPQVGGRASGGAAGL